MLMQSLERIWKLSLGQATDIQIQAEEIIKLKKQLINIYVKHTKQCYDKLQQDMERDNFMSPEEAKRIGLIDHVLEHPPQTEAEGEVMTTLKHSNG
nr:ATP-dependent Clp protease proteolytic subunit, mitochondrial isoform X2 [Bactrocera oleae]